MEEKETSTTANLEEKINEMDIQCAEGFENLPKLFISQTEKFMDDYTGAVKELRGLFKIPKANSQVGNLHQQICNTAQKQFEETNGNCSLFGLDFS